MQSNQNININYYYRLIINNARLLVSSALTIITTIFIISYLLPKSYEAKSTVFIEKSVVADLVKGIAVTPTLEDKLRELNYSIASRTLLLKVIDELDMNLKHMSDLGQEELIKKVQSNLKVKLPNQKESLFIITYRDSDPRLASDFVNTLLRRYIEQNVSANKDDTVGATQFFSDQLRTYKEKLDKAESDLNAYKLDKGAIVSMEPASLQQEINVAQQRLDDIRIRRTQLESNLVSLKKVSPLLLKQSALQKQLDELRAQFTDNYPEIRRIQSEIESIQSQMRNDVKKSIPEQFEQEKIHSEIRALKQAEENLRSVISSNRSFIQGIPVVRAKLEVLEREKSAQKALYEQMVSRHGQSEVSKQLTVQDKSTNFRIVDPAVIPIKPVSPNRLRIMLLGVIGGIIGSIGLLLLIDSQDKTIKSVDDLKIMNVPILVSIPKIHNINQYQSERKKNVRLAIASIVYCIVLSSFVVIEIFDTNLVDNMLAGIYHYEIISTLKSMLH